MDAESFIYETLSNEAEVLAYTASVTAMVIPEDVTGAAITFCRLSTVPQGEDRFVADLALRLNKTIAEIEALPSMELTKWIAYFHVLNREEEEKNKAEERARLEAIKRNNLLKGEL
jgi:hypothetical protein